MKSSQSTHGTIYFDGLCKVCSSEMDHYRKLPGSDHFHFIDITNPQFKAEDHGINPLKVHQVMHVKDSNGVLHEGVDAFRVIWRELPRYQFLARLSENFLANFLLHLGYRGFIKIRPFLPRKKLACSESPYCEVTK